MKKTINFFAAIILGGVILFSGCNNVTNEPMKAKQIPLEDFFKNPEKTAYQISPDGKFYSYLAPFEKRLNIFVQERGKEEATRLTSETDRDIAGYYWANNNQILFLKDQGGGRKLQTIRSQKRRF